ncbi:hypothetical protein BACERE00191_01984 [Bacillus pacificus]|uniref:Uncharacterized protein n=1 Tax=Bacillus pacificus TaxID=2026187 RepID=A0A1Y5ZGS8_9BACI|nr:hypothetical protein BACERE00191_01984 [Bacillus pacificus]
MGGMNYKKAADFYIKVGNFSFYLIFKRYVFFNGIGDSYQKYPGN